ncbi:MAG: NAD(P)/FAD-dependent oxidoreductase [Eubacterium sp.]
MKTYDIIVVGGGAAGMMAAIAAAKEGMHVALIEKNEKLGKKIYITGKGRCNLTNACETEDFFSSVNTNAKFMYSSLYSLTNFQTIDLFQGWGLSTKVERGNRVFPVSDKSSDVIQCLWNECKRSGVDIHLNTTCEQILYDREKACAVQINNTVIWQADSIILATGGLSYPSTGSTGDGIRFAQKSGHRITPCRPALVPMNIKEPDAMEMQGLSMKNVEVTFYIQKENGKKQQIYRDFGEMMFTHFGITGPIVLSASHEVGKRLENDIIYAILDCKPALSVEKLDKRLVRDFEESPNTSLKNCLGKLLPKSMIPVVLKRTSLDGGVAVNQITKKERSHLVSEIKGMRFTVHSLRDWKEAIITSGGVSVKDIDPSTMESKKIKNLFFAGEMIDVDAMTGGYNLQIAWSTGYLAGKMAAEKSKDRKE